MPGQKHEACKTVTGKRYVTFDPTMDGSTSRFFATAMVRICTIVRKQGIKTTQEVKYDTRAEQSDKGLEINKLLSVPH